MKLLFEVSQDVTGTGNTLFAWQSVLGNFLAISGTKREVLVCNRQGQLVETIVLPGLCTSLDWDKEGEYLAITQDYNGSLFLWNSNKGEVVTVETGIKEGLTLALWAKHSTLLAIGTSKGNLVLYNHRTRRKIPVIGKHSKRITSGVWSHQNVLALTGEDRKITFSDQDGNGIAEKEMKFDLHSLKFSPDGVTLIAIGGTKVAYLFEIAESTSPLELVFEPQYGDITSYCWRDNEQIILGFSKGFMIMISRKKDELGRELYQSRDFKNRLSDIDVASSAPIVATLSNNQIKLHEFSHLEGMYGMFQIEETNDSLSKLKWTPDSQLLTASFNNGGIMTFLVQLPQLGDYCESLLAYLTSLLQVNVVQIGSEDPPLTIKCPIEPSFLAVGPTHLAVGMNNRIWFTEITENKSKNFNERSYIGTISSVKLNEKYCAVLTNGNIELHLIDSSPLQLFDSDQNTTTPESKTFPDEGDPEVIVSFGLTTSFLIYCTESGNVVHFCLKEWQYLNNFKHVIGISQIYPDSTGNKVVIIDEKCDAFLYNPISDYLLQLPDVSPSVTSIVWDSYPDDRYILLCCDKEKVVTYVYHEDTIEGTCCVSAGSTNLPYGYKPIHLYQGELTCLTLTGKLNSIHLDSHCYSDDQDLSETGLKASFNKSLTLRKLRDAWSFAAALDVKECWEELVSVALYHFDIKLAIHASQQIQDVSMVYSLKEIEFMEDRNLVAGYISLFNNNFEKAQKLFLESSEPVAALEMRCDLLQWDQALELAKTLAPGRIPILSRQYAQQLEFIGDYGNALIHYEKGITSDPKLLAHDNICLAGLARCSLYTGDMRRGVKLAQASSDNQLKKECAAILESLKLFGDAGSLYEQAEYWEEATNAFIKVKNWEKVGVLLSKLPQATKLQAQYAKAREADGYYQEAAVAYEKAGDYDNAIRVYLDSLKLPDEAVRIVNDTHSIEGAKQVATFFQNINDYSSALKFLVLSKCNNDAFIMAQSHNQMDKYADVIGDNGTTNDYLRIASYYQETNNPFKAGLFFFKGKEYKEALDHFLACPTTLFPDGENIEMAIQVVGAAKKESLTAHLHSYLMGELDNEPKEARFLFGMYVSLKMYPKAAQTAILIAKEDQLAGNYRNARDMLYQMYKELCEHNIKIPNEMKQGLMLLHSYLLVKIHVKLGAHDKAARLLIRVANNISKFPSHIVQILTSTVIECQRSGLKESAFTYAAMLMRPEYRSEIDIKWKKKLENIVRKPERSEVEDPVSPCPVCSYMLPQMKLDCQQCKSSLPYCIVTGRHIISDDWCECPSCHFPALFSQFKELLESGADKVCPLCSADVELKQLILVSDIQPKLKSYTENFKY